MAEYTYTVSLRFSHASRDPAEITAALGIEPHRFWRVGERRKTPKGTPLDGVYTQSYWTAQIISGSSVERDLRLAIGDALDYLEARKDFFQDFASNGGRPEFFVGWFFDDGNSGDVFDHALLTRLADFRIDLSLDVYPASPSDDDG